MANLMTSYVWHKSPTIYATVSYGTSRPDGETSAQVNTDITISMSVRSGSWFNWEVWCYVSVNGGPETRLILNYGQGNGNSPNTGSWSDSQSTTIVQDVTSSSESIRVRFVCGQEVYYGKCDASGGPYSYDGTFNVGVPAYNPWQAPDTSGFYGYAQSEGASQDKVVKPDGTIHCWCGGLSGGAGNGTYQSYSMYIDVTRNNKLIVDNLSLGDGTDFRFKPWDKYQARPGDLIYVHAVVYTKNEGGGIYQLIDRDVTRYSPITVYKDGAIYLKNGSNKREIVGAYLKDSNGNRVKLSNIKIKDGSNKRSIDLYTTQYE